MSERALLVLELTRTAWSRPRRAASDQPGVDVDHRAGQLGGDRGGVDLAVRRGRAAPGPSAGGRTRLTTTPPTGRPASRSSAMPSDVSCTGISSSSVTRCTAVRRRAQQLHHRVGLRLDRPDLGEAGDLGVDLEELADAAGGRGVEDHGVVRDRSVPVRAALDGLVDLAGEQDVADAGGDGGGEVDHAELVERLPGAAELVEHREVLQQRRLRVDVQRVDLPGAAGRVGRTLRDARSS